MESPRTIPPLLQKAVITALVGGLAYLLSVLLVESGSTSAEISQLLITVFISGAALLIQYMGDFERRLLAVQMSQAKHAEEMNETVGAGFAHINEATQLFGMLQSSQLPTDEVVELVRNATEIKAGDPGVINDFAKEEVARIASLMKDLKADQVEYEGEDRDWILGLTGCASSSINAISTAVDTVFWKTELGRRYLAAQRDAVKRGVKVRRLFVVDRPEATADWVLEQCRSHEGLGIEVRMAYRSAVPFGAMLDPMYGFIVFDEAVSYEVIPEDGSEDMFPSIAATRLVLRSERVANRMDRFSQLWETGEELSEMGLA